MTQRAIDGPYIYFVTTLVKNREWFFVYPDRADRLGRVIRNACAMKRFDLFAYCILPNHAHLLVRKRASTDEQAQRALEKTRCDREMSRQPHTSTTQSGLFPPLFSISRKAGSRHRLWRDPAESGDRMAVTSPRMKRYTLSQLMQSIKGNYSWQTTDEGLWHPRFNFRIVETEQRFVNTVNYIIYNYTKK